MEKELCAAKELNEGLALANGKLKEENSALAIKLDASLSSLVRAENECAEHKKEIERLKNADCRKPRHLLTRQYSCDSNCSSSSEQSTEGEYYAPAMNFEPFTSRNDLYGIPSVQFELPRLPKKVTSRRSCLSNSKVSISRLSTPYSCMPCLNTFRVSHVHAVPLYDLVLIRRKIIVFTMNIS